MSPPQRHPRALIPPATTCAVAKKTKSESTNADAPHTGVKKKSKGFHRVMRRRKRSTTLFLLTPQHPSLMRSKPLLSCLMERTKLKTRDTLIKKVKNLGLKTTPSHGALSLRTERSKVNLSVSVD